MTAHRSLTLPADKTLAGLQYNLAPSSLRRSTIKRAETISNSSGISSAQPFLESITSTRKIEMTSGLTCVCDVSAKFRPFDFHHDYSVSSPCPSQQETCNAANGRVIIRHMTRTAPRQSSETTHARRHVTGVVAHRADRRCQSNGVRRYAARPPSRARRCMPRECATRPTQQSVSACRLAS